MPDTITIRRTQWGWSAFEDPESVIVGSDGLIASSNHLSGLVEYIATLQPARIIIENGDDHETLCGACHRPTTNFL